VTQQAQISVATHRLAHLPPTQYLIMEILASRYRLGEPFWTFPTFLRAPLAALQEAGLLWFESGVAPKSLRATLTDQGKAAVLEPGYEPPSSPTAHLVIDAHDVGGAGQPAAQVFNVWLDEQEAHTTARAIRGVIVAVPITADYRTETPRRADT
jgi:hypothetical protein